MSEPVKAKQPKITSVSFGLSVNLGNYESAKFDLTAEVAADEDWRVVLDSLRKKSAKIRTLLRTERGIDDNA